MKTLLGFDENGNAIFEDAKIHRWEDLPMHGFGKSFKGVGLYEIVILPFYYNIDEFVWNSTIWEFTKYEIVKRAIELDAEYLIQEHFNAEKKDFERILWFRKLNKQT